MVLPDSAVPTTVLSLTMNEDTVKSLPPTFDMTGGAGGTVRIPKEKAVDRALVPPISVALAARDLPLP